MHAGTRSALASIWAAVHSPAGLSFSETVSQLASLGVTRYRVDYIARNITAYSTSVSTTNTPIAPQADTTPLPQGHDAYTFGSWDKDGIVLAVRKAQAAEGSYLDFSREVVRSGVVEYTVYVGGQRVVYMGSEGEVWMEWFDGGGGDDV